MSHRCSASTPISRGNTRAVKFDLLLSIVSYTLKLFKIFAMPWFYSDRCTPWMNHQLISCLWWISLPYQLLSSTCKNTAQRYSWINIFFLLCQMIISKIKEVSWKFQDISHSINSTNILSQKTWMGFAYCRWCSFNAARIDSGCV